jgi:hypothetical protein
MFLFGTSQKINNPHDVEFESINDNNDDAMLTGFNIPVLPLDFLLGHPFIKIFLEVLGILKQISLIFVFKGNNLQ